MVTPEIVAKVTGASKPLKSGHKERAASNLEVLGIFQSIFSTGSMR